VFNSVLGQGENQRSQLGAGTLASIVIHVAIITLVAAFSTPLALNQEKEPDERQVVFLAPRRPPPPPPPAPTAVVVPRTTPPKKKPELVAPRVIPPAPPEPKEPPKEEPPPEPPPVTGPPDSTTPASYTGPVDPNSTTPFDPNYKGPYGPPGQGGPGRYTSEVLPFGEGMTRPKQVSGLAAPQYTREALESGVEGKAIVRCTLSIEGRARDCQVIKSLPLMDRAILDWISDNRYAPVMFQGKPVSVKYVFIFQLAMPGR
jgi:periplasmic protein TonB